MLNFYNLQLSYFYVKMEIGNQILIFAVIIKLRTSRYKYKMFYAAILFSVKYDICICR